MFELSPKWAPTIAHTDVEQNILDQGILESTFIGNDDSINSLSSEVILWWLEGDSLIW